MQQQPPWNILHKWERIKKLPPIQTKQKNTTIHSCRIEEEILDLPVPSRHGKKERNGKEIITLELVQYYQYHKCVSKARPHSSKLAP